MPFSCCLNNPLSVILKQMTNPQFTDDFHKEAKQRGSTKSMGDVVGLPDDIDKARIQRFLLRYERKHPGEIQFHRDMARERTKAGKNDYGVVDPTSARRYLFELPEQIGIWLGEAYPLMFKEKSHTRWFAKNFPELLIPRKY